MKIVQVIDRYLPQEPGGAQLHVAELARGLQARGHGVEVFTGLPDPDRDAFSVTRDEWAGVAVTRVGYCFQDVTRFEHIYVNRNWTAVFAEFLERARPDLVHFHHFSGLSTTLLEVAAERGFATAVTLHDYWLVCPRGQRLHPETLAVCADLDRGRCAPCLQKLWPHLLPDAEVHDELVRWEEHMHRMLDLARVVITPSRFHRARFVEWGVEPARCVVVAHGLRRDSLLAEPRGRKPVRSIGYIGAVIPSKGVHVLLDAFQRLDRRDLSLHVHGQMPPFHEDRAYGDRLAAAIRPGFEVHLHGRYRPDELPRILAGLDVLVVPPIWWEAFCLTIREGVLAGLPVVAAETGAIEEAVADGLALGFPPGDAGALAEVLARLLADDELRERMSRKADLVRGIESCVAETEEVYRRALGNAGEEPWPGRR